MDIEIIQADGTMDLNEELITHPHTTFFVRATGTSMTGAGVYPEDILIEKKKGSSLDIGHTPLHHGPLINHIHPPPSYNRHPMNHSGYKTNQAPLSAPKTAKHNPLNYHW